MHEPKLRFTADDGSKFPDWEEKKIGDIGCFIKGAGLSKADISNVGTPLILYGELYTTYSEVAYDIKRKTQAVVDDKYYSLIGDVIIPTSGESAEEISTATCVMVPGVVLGGDLNIFRSSILDGRIMSYILNHQAKWKIVAIAQGKSIVHVQAKQLANIPVRYPVSECEQRKIADFLSMIDTVIEKQKATITAWEERKKGVMQKLFSQGVRFKADDGSEFPDWEEKKLGDIFEFYNGKAHENAISENGKYVVVNSKFISTDGTVRKYTNEMIFPLIKNDIVMVMSDVPNGKAISKCFLINENNKYTLNQRICCLRTKENAVFYINQISRNKYFLKFDDGVKQTNLRKNDILQCPLLCPCLAEQQKIADCLSSLDDVIEKQKATLAAWKEMKKGLLQQMFV